MNFKVVFDYTRFPDEETCKNFQSLSWQCFLIQTMETWNIQSLFRHEKLENIQSTFQTGIRETKNVKKSKSFETRRFVNGRPYGAGLQGLWIFSVFPVWNPCLKRLWIFSSFSGLKFLSEKTLNFSRLSLSVIPVWKDFECFETFSV